LYLRTSGESGGAIVLVVTIPLDYCITAEKLREFRAQE